MRQLLGNVKKEIRKNFFNGKKETKVENGKKGMPNNEYQGYYCNTTRWQTL